MKKTRAVPGIEAKTAEEAAAALYEWLEAGANWDEPETQQRKYARGTKPPPQKRAKTVDTAAEHGETPTFAPLPAGSIVKNATMAAFLARGARVAAPAACSGSV